MPNDYPLLGQMSIIIDHCHGDINSIDINGIINSYPFATIQGILHGISHSPPRMIHNNISYVPIILSYDKVDEIFNCCGGDSRFFFYL